MMPPPGRCLFVVPPASIACVGAAARSRRPTRPSPPSFAASRRHCVATAPPNFARPCWRCRPKEAAVPLPFHRPPGLDPQRRRSGVVESTCAAAPVIVRRPTPPLYSHSPPTSVPAISLEGSLRAAARSCPPRPRSPVPAQRRGRIDKRVRPRCRSCAAAGCGRTRSSPELCPHVLCGRRPSWRRNERVSSRLRLWRQFCDAKVFRKAPLSAFLVADLREQLF